MQAARQLSDICLKTVHADDILPEDSSGRWRKVVCTKLQAARGSCGYCCLIILHRLRAVAAQHSLKYLAKTLHLQIMHIVTGCFSGKKKKLSECDGLL